jgi:uncharacterized protein (DUF427 family)
MSLTMGTAPFGHAPAGTFNDAVNTDGQVIWWEDSPRRVRGMLGGETVVDSTRVKLLHEKGHMLRWYFPLEDVNADLLEATDHHTRCPFKGEASYFTVRAGGKVAENAAWHYPEPIDGAPPLAGHVSFYWDKLDEWWEEDERVHVHPRDPYHRVDVLSSSRHVRVSLDGQTLAESTSTKALFESNLPTRWYFPLEDVNTELLAERDLQTGCPYKGVTARYFDAPNDEVGVAWVYDEVVPAVTGIEGRVAFFNERVDLEVDGDREERPRTPWTTSDWVTSGRRI